ncbi:MAG: hypothetical protein R3E79_30020 [Caldilineaceae bacterium]
MIGAVDELDGDSGEPLPGYTLEEAISISGDHLFAHPRWQAHQDLSALVGKPVRIEVLMREAELFAIRIPAKSISAPKRRIRCECCFTVSRSSSTLRVEFRNGRSASKVTGILEMPATLTIHQLCSGCGFSRS